MAITLDRVGWQNGTLVQPAKVLEDNTIQEAQYEGATPLSAENLKKMEDNTQSAVNQLYTMIQNSSGGGGGTTNLIRYYRSVTLNASETTTINVSNPYSPEHSFGNDMFIMAVQVADEEGVITTDKTNIEVDWVMQTGSADFEVKIKNKTTSSINGSLHVIMAILPEFFIEN